MGIQYDPDSQSADFSTVSVDRALDSLFIFTLENFVEAVKKINSGLLSDMFPTKYLKFSGLVFLNLLCKVYNKNMSHRFVPCIML